MQWKPLSVIWTMESESLLKEYLDVVVGSEFSKSFPMSATDRASAVAAFKASLEGDEKRSDKLGVTVSRASSLAFWKHYRKKNASLTDKEVHMMRRKVAAIRKRQKRALDRECGIGTNGKLLVEHRWRMLEMGDYKETTWQKKLSFIPVLSVGRFGASNLAKLQTVQERLVDAVRLRGGATKQTKKHQSGSSLGRTVMSGGRLPRALRKDHSADPVSGTIQLKKFCDSQLQSDAIEAVTACIEEAFGNQAWYKVAKECFKMVPNERRLPNSSVPGLNLWWSWNTHKSVAHIDANTVPPCFVLCPYTYHGAELLCAAGRRKIPLVAGRVVGGSWQRFPHCNDALLDDRVRYVFVAYFDYRMLSSSYITK